MFGVEKEKGKVEGILAAVYQDVFGAEVYPSLEEKAANLLYFMIKDHPYNDGCKRIAASLFLEFLSRNNALYSDGEKIISDGALVAITLMIAESRSDEKDIMVALVMKLLTIINADEIKRTLHCTDMEAAVKAAELRELALKAGSDFTFETVLSTGRNLNLLIRAKGKGCLRNVRLSIFIGKMNSGARKGLRN